MVKTKEELKDKLNELNKEELIQLKAEYELLNNKHKELTENELKEVTGGEPYPSVSPSPIGPNVNGSVIVERAISCLGKPYAWGAVGPNEYDDSGLVSYCVSGSYSRIGTCATFMNWSRASSPTPGDICVNASHCGIYVGDGQMIHAPTFGQSVCYSNVHSGMIFVRP